MRQILAEHYVHRNEAELVKSTIREKGRHKVIDKVTVALNDKDDVYEAEFANLGIKKVLVDPNTVKAHPKLLVGGVWCICDIEYDHQLDATAVPWMLGSLKPIQLSQFDYDAYLAARRRVHHRRVDRPADPVHRVQPGDVRPPRQAAAAGAADPLLRAQLQPHRARPQGHRQVPHLLGVLPPRHADLRRRGDRRQAVRQQRQRPHRSGRLLGLSWPSTSSPARRSAPDKALVDIMKNYMANKSFSRGVETLGAEASMVFVGNTAHTVPYMLKHSDLFDELPERVPRLGVPGPAAPLHPRLGGRHDPRRDVLRRLRVRRRLHRRGPQVDARRTTSPTATSSTSPCRPDISTRDRDGIHKTFSGLMKILYPHGEATTEEIEELLRFAIEGRKRVKDQLVRMDATIPAVAFAYTDATGAQVAVTTLEEREYPGHYYRKATDSGTASGATGPEPSPTLEPGLPVAVDGGPPAEPSAAEPTPGTQGPASPPAAPLPQPGPVAPQPGHVQFQENQKGVSYDRLFGPYLTRATTITVVDPYVRQFHQARNLMEFIETVAKHTAVDDEVAVKLVTIEDEDPEQARRQLEFLAKVMAAAGAAGIGFTVELDQARAIHDREIRTDTGWKIILGRGLDIFQYVSGDPFDMANRMQEYRRVKAFGVTFLREGR